LCSLLCVDKTNYSNGKNGLQHFFSCPRIEASTKGLDNEN